jgi:hypothetical protein
MIAKATAYGAEITIASEVVKLKRRAYGHGSGSLKSTLF